MGTGFRLSNLGRIPDKARVCIYGAGGRGERLLRAIRAFRKDVTVVFFVDTHKTGTFESLPVIGPRELVEQKDSVDIVIVASLAEFQILNFLLAQGMHNLLLASQFFFTKVCLPSREAIRTREYHTVLNALDRDEDKQFFAEFADIMRVTDNVRKAEDVVYAMYSRYDPPYCAHINREAVRYVLDAGVAMGESAIVFCHAFPQATIYGFEPEVESFDYGLYHDYLLDRERFVFVPLALSDEITELRFAAAEKFAHRTFGEVREDGERVVQATTVDAFVESQGLGEGGFIKVMVNGYEYPVVRGALKTMTEHRPQMAIHLRSMGMQEDPLFRTMNLCVEHLDGYRFRLSHWTATELHTVFTCIPEELAD